MLPCPLNFRPIQIVEKSPQKQIIFKLGPAKLSYFTQFRLYYNLRLCDIYGG